MADNISLVVAFGAGLLSFLSPCVLSLVPVYLASLYTPETYGSRSAGPRVPLLLHSIVFIAGFSVVFIAMGAAAGLTGYVLKVGVETLGKIAGGLLIAFGLFMLAALKVPWLNYEKHLARPAGRTTGYLRSLLIGATFSLGWTACVGPILGGILALASIRATAWEGAWLLSIYSLGLGLPFFAMGLAFDSLAPLLKRIRAYSTAICIVSSLLLIATGVLIMSNNLVRFFSIVPRS